MINAFELQSLNNVYQYLQLCKKLRQPTWQKQILAYHKQERGYAFLSLMINTLQKWVPPVTPVNVFILHPEFKALMVVNSMVRIQINRNVFNQEQQKDLDWFYLALLQRWLKKHTDSKLVKNIATKHQSHLDTIEKMIESVMCSDPIETLLLKFSLPLANGEISNTIIDGAWVHLNNSLKSVLSNSPTTHPNREVGFIKKLSLARADPMFCGCLHITHVTKAEKNKIIWSLLNAKLQCEEINYIAIKPLISKSDFFTKVFPIRENNPSNLNEQNARWKIENQCIKNDNARNKDNLRQTLFSVLDPFEELIMQVNLNGPLIDQRYKKRFFSSSLIMDK